MGWAPGSIVGSYEVIGLLGNGGMGEVYKVRHPISQRVEAIKVLLSGSAQRPEVADRFLREIRVLANLSHQNIAAFHTAFHHEDQLIMVMEFVEGMNLSERLARGLTLQHSLNYMRQVLSAIAYAHAQGVIHRDIKPSNIMINSAGQIKLLDFGLAKMSSPDPRLTASGSILGSVHYISPEQIRGETPDARSDIYALGVTLYELVTGTLPIKGNSLPEIIAGHLQTTPQAPFSVSKHVPEELSWIVMRSLEKNPAQRFQTAAAFLSALEDVQVDSSKDWSVTLDATVVAPLTPLPSPPPQTSAARSQSHQTGSSAKKYDSAVLEDISAQLANYVGPIARIIVKRASSSSNNLRELCDKVAQEIDSENNRKTFLSSVRKHLRVSEGF